MIGPMATRVATAFIESGYIGWPSSNISAYSSIAANEAEKYCDVRLVDIRFFGAAGRIYLAGSESEVQAAAQKIVETLSQIKGRKQ